MPTYKAPLDHYRFLMNDVFAIDPSELENGQSGVSEDTLSDIARRMRATAVARGMTTVISIICSTNPDATCYK